MFIRFKYCRIKSSEVSVSNIEMHSRISRNLANSHIIISPENEWFKQCVDFFVSDNPNVINKRSLKLIK